MTNILVGAAIVVVGILVFVFFFLKNNPKKKQALIDKAIEEVKNKVSGV